MRYFFRWVPLLACPAVGNSEALANKSPANHLPGHPVTQKLLFHFYNRAPHVITALRANGVRRHGLAALRAVGELLGRFMIVSPATAGFLIRLSSLRDGHDTFLSAERLMNAAANFGGKKWLVSNQPIYGSKAGVSRSGCQRAREVGNSVQSNPETAGSSECRYSYPGTTCMPPSHHTQSTIFPGN